MKNINIPGIEVRNGVPYIRDTDVTVGDILDDCWDYKGEGSAYTHAEIIANHKQNGVELTYGDLNKARQYAMAVLAE